jgi:hypothetical protein
MAKLPVWLFCDRVPSPWNWFVLVLSVLGLVAFLVFLVFISARWSQRPQAALGTLATVAVLVGLSSQGSRLARWSRWPRWPSAVRIVLTVLWVVVERRRDEAIRLYEAIENSTDQYRTIKRPGCSPEPFNVPGLVCHTATAKLNL